MIRKRPQPRNVFEAIIVDGDESQFVVVQRLGQRRRVQAARRR